MIKTVKECDYCQAQIDWKDINPDSTPEGWRKITIVAEDHMGESGEPIIIEVCPEHKDRTVGYIISVCLDDA